MLTFSVSGAQGVMEQGETLTSGMVGKQARFIFSPEWAELTPVAVFTAGREVRDAAVEDGVAVIPWEVLAAPGHVLYAGVCGISGDGETVIPTVRMEGPVILPGANPSGDPGADPELDIWAKMLLEMEDLRSGRDGTEYASAGESVRSQLTQAEQGLLQVVNARSAEYDMDVIFKSGAHFRAYMTNGSTLGTPYKYGITNMVASLIFSYANSATHGVQMALINGNEKIWTRKLLSGVMGDWKCVGPVETDANLTKSGAPADAKAVGEKLKALYAPGQAGAELLIQILRNGTYGQSQTDNIDALAQAMGVTA